MPEVTMDDVTKIVGSKEIELTLLRSEIQRLKAELALAKNGSEAEDNG